MPVWTRIISWIPSFYSYRNEDGTCGRYAAIGVML